MEKRRSRDAVPPETEEEKILPVIEEELKVGKRVVETGTTRIRKVIREREEVVDEPLLQEEVQVTRVPVNKYIDRPVAVRQEDGTTIIPIVEEVMVVEKRLLLKEELYITKRVHSVRAPQKVALRSEEAIVERSDSAGRHRAEGR